MADRPIMLETRTVETSLELRDADTAAPVLEGYAATFNQEYDLGAFREVIDPQAFTRTLQSGPDVRLLVDHEGQPLARTKSGTLELTADTQGLHMRSTLDPSDPDVQRLLPKMRRGDLDQMSFGFRVPKGGDTWDNDLRTLREINLAGGDVSVVTYPANPNTAATLRARDTRSALFAYVQHILDDIRSEQPVTDEDMTRFRAALDDLAPFEEHAAKEPYGDVAYADPGYQPDGQKRYPIDTADHVRAAWSYINQTGNQSPYTAEQVASIKSRIKAAAEKFGVEISEANSARPLSLALAIAQRLGVPA